MLLMAAALVSPATAASAFVILMTLASGFRMLLAGAAALTAAM